MRNGSTMYHLDKNESFVVKITVSKTIIISANNEEYYNAVYYDLKNKRQLISFKNQVIQAVEGALKNDAE